MNVAGPTISSLQPPRSCARERLAAVDWQSILTGTARLCDFGAAAGGATAAYFARYSAVGADAGYWSFGLLGAVLLVNYLNLSEAYRFEALRQLRSQIWKVSANWTAVAVTLILLAYSLKLSADFSRTWTAIWFFSTLSMLVSTRIAAAALIARWQRNGRLVRRVGVIGTRRLVEQVARQVALHEGASVICTAMLPRPNGAESHPSVRSDGIEMLLSLAKSSDIDEIIVASDTPLGHPALRDFLGIVRSYAIEVRYHAFALRHPVPSQRLNLIVMFGLPLLSLVERPLTGWARVGKRAEDICISSITLMICFPLLALIAVAIKLDSRGPVLFRQDRLGFNNNPVPVLKFRTMYHRLERDDGQVQARRNDARITRVGRFLRRTSLDELPQLFNVLKGDMSLIGPRPHPLALNDKFADRIDGYLARHRVKPGITGWAQVNGLRGETDTLEKMRRRIEHDLYYIENWSPWLDLKILLYTTLVVIHENAY